VVGRGHAGELDDPRFQLVSTERTFAVWYELPVSSAIDAIVAIVPDYCVSPIASIDPGDVAGIVIGRDPVVMIPCAVPCTKRGGAAASVTPESPMAPSGSVSNPTCPHAARHSTHHATPRIARWY